MKSYTYAYPRAAMTTDALVLAIENGNHEILLIQRGKDPFKGEWALPGGFIHMDETLEVACIRELEEETGIVLHSMEQFKTYDAIDRDPRHRTISVAYWAQVDRKISVQGADDADKADWFPIDKLPKLAFDHQQIIEEFLLFKELK